MSELKKLVEKTLRVTWDKWVGNGPQDPSEKLDFEEEVKRMVVALAAEPRVSEEQVRLNEAVLRRAIEITELGEHKPENWLDSSWQELCFNYNALLNTKGTTLLSPSTPRVSEERLDDLAWELTAVHWPYSTTIKQDAIFDKEVRVTKEILHNVLLGTQGAPTPSEHKYPALSQSGATYGHWVCLPCGADLGDCPIDEIDEVFAAHQKTEQPASPAPRGDVDLVKELTNRIGTAAALFTMEYNEAAWQSRRLEYGLDSKINPVIEAVLAAWLPAHDERIRKDAEAKWAGHGSCVTAEQLRMACEKAQKEAEAKARLENDSKGINELSICEVCGHDTKEGEKLLGCVTIEHCSNLLAKARLEEAKNWDTFYRSGEIDEDIYWNQHRIATLEKEAAKESDDAS